MPILIRAVSLLLNFIEYAILIDVVLSWIPQRRGNRLTQIVHIFTEPLLSPARDLQRRVLPQSPIDISPIIAIMFLRLIRYIIYIIL